MGNFEEALLDFSKTISLDPQNAHAYYHRGKAKEELGLLKDAQIDFDSAKEFGFNPQKINSTEKEI